MVSWRAQRAPGRPCVCSVPHWLGVSTSGMPSLSVRLPSVRMEILCSLELFHLGGAVPLLMEMAQVWPLSLPLAPPPCSPGWHPGPPDQLLARQLPTWTFLRLSTLLEHTHSSARSLVSSGIPPTGSSWVWASGPMLYCPWHVGGGGLCSYRFGEKVPLCGHPTLLQPPAVYPSLG